MHSERGLLIDGTWRRHGGSRPSGKHGDALCEPVAVGLLHDAQAPAAEGFGPMAAITPPATDKVSECANGDVHGLAACASNRPAPPSGGIKHGGMGCEGAADRLDIKLSPVGVR